MRSALYAWILSLMVKAERPALSCRGSVIYDRSVFCFDEERDTDMLIDSFLETDSQSLAASRPAKIIRIFIPAPVAPKPPATAAPTVAPTTPAPTTTLPPNRRRLAAGWAASGKSPCEDTNPSDAADSDCYLLRFGMLKDDIYGQLQTVSQAVQTTATYADKLGAYIDSVKIPSFQTSLGTALQTASTVLTSVSNNAIADVTAQTAYAQTDTTSLVTALESKEDATRLSLQNRIQQAFNNLAAVDKTNLNTLIKRANDINTVLGNTNFVKSLQSFNTDGSLQVLNHGSNLTSLAAKLSLARDQVITSLYYLQSNFTSVKIPRNQYDLETWVSTKLNSMNSSLGDLIALTVSLSNMTSVVTQTDTQLVSTLNAAQQALTDLITRKKAAAKAAMDAVASSQDTAVTGIENSYTSLNSGIQTVQLNVESDSFVKYAGEIAELEALQTFLGTFGVDYITAWETSANDRLAKLRQYLKEYSEYLRDGISTASDGGTNDVKNRVLDSLAQIGLIQGQLDSELLKRQSDNLSSIHSLMKEANRAAVNFPQILATVTSTIESLRASTAVSEPLDLISKISGSMDNLGLALTQTGKLSASRESSTEKQVATKLSDYELQLRDWWKSKLQTGVGASLKAQIDTSMQTETDKLSNISATVDSLSRSLAPMTRSALFNVQTGLNALHNSGVISSSVAGDALALVSSKAAMGYTNVSTAIQSVEANLASLLASGEVDSMTKMNEWRMSSGLAEIDSETSTVESGVKSNVDGLNDSVKSSLVQPASDLLRKMQVVNAGSVRAVSNLKSMGGMIEYGLARKIGSLDASTSLGDTVGATLESLNQLTVSANQVTSKVSDLSSRISTGGRTLSSNAAKLVSLSASLTNLGDKWGQGSEDSVASLTRLIGFANKIDSILDAEIASLLQGLLAARADLEKTITRSVSVDSDSVLSQWFQDANSTLKSKWTDGSVSAAQAQLEAESTAAINAISNESVLPDLDKKISADIASYSTKTNDLISDLSSSVVRVSSKSNEILTDLQNSLGIVSESLAPGTKDRAQHQLDQVQLIMDTVGSSVADGTSDVAGSILDAARAVGKSLESSQRKEIASATVADAIGAVNEGLGTMGSVNELLAANQAERESAAESVLDQIKTSSEKVQELLKDAIGEVGSGTDIGSVDLTLLEPGKGDIEKLASQLETWHQFVANQGMQITELESDTNMGVEGEKQKLLKDSQKIASDVTEGVGTVQSALSKVQTASDDLEDRLNQLSIAEDRLPLDMSSKTSLNTGSISDLIIGDSTAVLAQEQAAFTETESRVDSWITAANR